jgi:antitoxin (DNA-binding transcriptional repressor) of toxin-antitoxin stability system
MVKINIHEAKTHLSEHLERLESGDVDVVVICRRNEPIAELRALAKRQTAPRRILVADPRFHLPAAFFEPLSDDTLDAFEGRSP